MPKLKSLINRSIFPLNTKKITIFAIVLIIAITYVLFFYLQNNTENNIKNTLFEQQEQRQIESTEGLSRHISSDLDLIMARLQAVSNSDLLQQGDISSNETKRLLQEMHTQIDTIIPIDRLLILDNNDIVTVDVITEGEETFVGIDFSYREWVNLTKATNTAVFSNGFDGIDGKYKLAISYPITHKNSGEYLGLVVTLIPTISFFEHYGNTYDIKSQYLAVLDRNAVQLIHPVKSFIGTSFFGNHTQQAPGHNEVLNNIIRTVMSGKPYFDTYEFRNGERLNTITVEGKPVYFIFVITPTSAIYSQFNDAILTQRIQTFTLLAGVTAAVVVLIIFLIKWNTNLNNEVKRRTKEVDESNEQLSEANEQASLYYHLHFSDDLLQCRLDSIQSVYSVYVFLVWSFQDKEKARSGQLN